MLEMKDTKSEPLGYTYSLGDSHLISRFKKKTV